MGSSWTRARTRVPCIGRQILNHCATREAQQGQYYSDTKTRQAHNKKRKLQANIPNECRCKNLQQNNSKLNSTINLKDHGDFPAGPVVKNPPSKKKKKKPQNPPSNAGHTGSIPGWGTKIPHATGQLSPHTTTTEPGATTTEPTHSEAHAPQLQSPCTLEPACHN